MMSVLLSPALRMSGTKEIAKMLPPIKYPVVRAVLCWIVWQIQIIPRGWEVEPKMAFDRKNGTQQSVVYSQQIPFEGYMTEAELIFVNWYMAVLIA